ncbi:hypothetical protein [Lysobacter fragariae]
MGDSLGLRHALGCFMAKNGGGAPVHPDPGLALVVVAGSILVLWFLVPRILDTSELVPRHNLPVGMIFSVLAMTMFGALLFEGFTDGSLHVPGRRRHGHEVVALCDPGTFWTFATFYYGMLLLLLAVLISLVIRLREPGVGRDELV